MPWVPSYTESELREAIKNASRWSEVLRALGIRYHGNSIATARKWAREWTIATEHLPASRSAPPLRKRYSERDLRAAVARSQSWAAALRELGYCPTGGDGKTLRRRCAQLGISTTHFDPYARSRGAGLSRRTPLSEILVENSTYNRDHLKRRLYDEGFKERSCERCGQGELWHGEAMGLILDHINGVRDDNRLANLRIVCPNCAATLETHCGRKNRLVMTPQPCVRCGQAFRPRYPTQRYCSPECGRRWERTGVARPQARRVERPPYEQLVREIAASGYCATGRKYGVSDNAIRKWMRTYEREGRKPSVSPAAP